MDWGKEHFLSVVLKWIANGHGQGVFFDSCLEVNC